MVKNIIQNLGLVYFKRTRIQHLNHMFIKYLINLKNFQNNIFKYYIMFGGLASRSGNALVGKSGFLGHLVAYLIILMLLLSFGKYLWNDVLVNVVPAVKPIESIWELLGLQILFSLLLCH